VDKTKEASHLLYDFLTRTHCMIESQTMIGKHKSKWVN